MSRNEVKFTDEQQAAMDIAMSSRDHLLITGFAGTGKSLLLERIIRGLRRQRKRVRVASYTGLAALRLKGSTLARLLGTGLAKSVEDLTSNNFDRAEENLDKVTDLVVDEASMVSGDYLNLMDKVMRMATGNEEPFGGIRLILCADFLQLPPVHNESDPKPRWKWCFEHPLFGLTRKISLTKSLRQGSAEDILILSELRYGHISFTGRRVLGAMVGRHVKNATELYPVNKTVREINRNKLESLKGVSKAYATWYRPDRYREMFQGQVPIEDEVVLKIGAPVIILANNPHAGYANGSQGVVVGMDWRSIQVKLNVGRTVEVDRKIWEINDVKGATIGTVEGLPIHLGWAATIHRAQGMTLDAVKTNATDCWEPGQAYVALTRTRKLSHISLTKPVTVFKVDPKALAFTKELEKIA